MHTILVPIDGAECALRALRFAAEHDKDVLGKAEAVLTPLQVRYATESIEGDPAERIVQRATELGCETIVMGTRGLGRLGTLVLGSVANKVMHLASMPVTLVK